MLVGKVYSLAFSGPFEGANGKETKLEAITSARTLLDYSVDVYTSIFQSVGLTRSDYALWLKSEALIYTFRIGDMVYKVPNGFFTEAPVIETTPYRQHLMVVEFPYLTPDEVTAVQATTDAIKDFYLRRHGLEAQTTLKPYGVTTEVKLSESQTIQTTRTNRKTTALNADASPEALKSLNADLQVKLDGLERIIIDRGIVNG